MRDRADRRRGTRDERHQGAAARLDMTEALKGVAFNAPPPGLLADAHRAIAALTKDLPPGTNGAVVGVATDAGVNAAVVHRVGDRFAVGAWIGKAWGSRIQGGGAIGASW